MRVLYGHTHRHNNSIKTKFLVVIPDLFIMIARKIMKNRRVSQLISNILTFEILLIIFDSRNISNYGTYISIWFLPK